MTDLFDFYPYAERYGVTRALLEHGRPREEILAQLREMAASEDEVWEAGGCSGTMYCGDHSHYAFLTEAFGLFAHQNALQRDMCPSATRFEGEIVAMALDLFHAGAVTDGEPAGMVMLRRDRRASPTRCSPTASTGARRAASPTRTSSNPRPVIPRSTRPATCSRIELRRAPVDPETTLVRPDAVAELIDGNTVAIVGSAGNYGYGTIDPIARARRPRAGAWRRPARRRLPRRLPAPVRRGARLPDPGVRLSDPRRDEHQRRHPQVRLRPEGHLNRAVPRQGATQPLLLLHAGLERRQVLLARHGGIALRWVARRDMGVARVARPRGLPRLTPRRSSRPRRRCRRPIRSHAELRLLGEPTFLFAFTSDAFDIYHVNDEMKRRGWRFNGLAVPERAAHGRHAAADTGRRRASASPRISTPLSRTP